MPNEAKAGGATNEQLAFWEEMHCKEFTSWALMMISHDRDVRVDSRAEVTKATIATLRPQRIQRLD